MSIFDTVLVKKPKRSKFDLSHEVKTTTDFGVLTPFLCTDVVPGDTFKCQSQSLVRMAPMLAPIMQNIDLYTHYFFVPYRLVWDDFEDYITGGPDGTKAPVKPFFGDCPSNASALFGNGSLSDYLGLPDISHRMGDQGINDRISTLAHRAYTLIYNEYYRDQNVTPEVPISKNSGEENYDSYRNYILRYRAYRKDYFTSALPWPQRIQTPVNIPITGIGSTQVNFSTVQFGSTSTGMQGKSLVAGYPSGPRESALAIDGSTQSVNISGKGTTNVSGLGTNILELRKSAKVQQWLEAAARGGARYIEQIFSHFGVKSSDARLQRPEYLGGGKSPIMISEVLQQSSSVQSGQNSNTIQPLGQMAGHGLGLQTNNSFKRFFEEHGVVIGILSILPKASYMNGIPRMFLKTDKFDELWPEFANIGEQEIYNGELFVENSSNPSQSLTDVFGYAPRYSEYKYIPSSFHGDFRNSLKFWHLGRSFNQQPNLNTKFIECRPEDNERIFTVGNFSSSGTTPSRTDNHHFWIQIYNKISAVRCLPKYEIPSLI